LEAKLAAGLNLAVDAHLGGSRREAKQKRGGECDLKAATVIVG
jgi:hypothetical protein